MAASLTMAPLPAGPLTDADTPRPTRGDRVKVADDDSPPRTCRAPLAVVQPGPGREVRLALDPRHAAHGRLIRLPAADSADGVLAPPARPAWLGRPAVSPNSRSRRSRRPGHGRPRAMPSRWAARSSRASSAVFSRRRSFSSGAIRAPTHAGETRVVECLFVVCLRFARIAAARHDRSGSTVSTRHPPGSRSSAQTVHESGGLEATWSRGDSGSPSATSGAARKVAELRWTVQGSARPRPTAVFADPRLYEVEASRSTGPPRLRAARRRRVRDRRQPAVERRGQLGANWSARSPPRPGPAVHCRRLRR